MTRGKKQSLSADELLKQALLPEDEQPYGVPENWIWTRLKAITINYDSKRVPLSTTQRGTMEKKYDYYGASGVIDKVEDFIFDERLLLIGEDGANLVTRSKPIAFIAEGKYWVNNHAHVLGMSSIMSLDYLCYYINSIDLIPYVTGSAQPKMTQDNMNKIPIPVPSIVEQQRIVDRIESLFTKLDQAEELAQSALDSFETRKAAILHKAFTGELTGKWREEHGIGKDTWSEKTFDQVADIKSNLVDPSEFMDSPHIAPDNIERRTGRLLEYRTIKEDGVTSGKHKFYKGQILYSKIRPYLSKVVLVDFDGLCSADMYPIEAKEDTKYLWYYMLSDAFLEQASSAGSRSVLPKINQKELSRLKVPIPTIPEQQEVVLILDKLFSKEHEIKELVDVIDQIEGMKKAILARAFRGLLGTNDPTEGSSLKLLIET
ncbi:restriction endonuclease subunit S [Cohnella sp. AR92]|uniref:restriction endonuclease subunit S n=1 Tax=Cohnella sp. AR92 TaxID=648716 RepID=UPI000F8D2AEC|nr:restriction endonuclease subunit S [Cohnella sp. AR92]RUS48587.1 restriction endonuclease subunit S [Cohnella sp. AR92]